MAGGGEMRTKNLAFFPAVWYDVPGVKGTLKIS